MDIQKARDAINEVFDELKVARTKFPAFNSAHEGFAVIQEEVDELWEEVKKKKHDRTKELLRGEAKQIAAMALRFMLDVCDD